MFLVTFKLVYNAYCWSQLFLNKLKIYQLFFFFQSALFTIKFYGFYCTPGEIITIDHDYIRTCARVFLDKLIKPGTAIH